MGIAGQFTDVPMANGFVIVTGTLSSLLLGEGEILMLRIKSSPNNSSLCFIGSPNVWKIGRTTIYIRETQW